MTPRQCLALEMAAFLAWNSGTTRPAVLGVVAEANRVRFNTGNVSEGATVYDGDRFETEKGGLLLLRGNATMLELAEESVLIVRSRPSGAQGAEAELSKGALVFSAVRADALEVAAQGAGVRPLRDARTLAQVSVTSAKELRIYARRGSLQFSYRGETETIAEGAVYRVILDPAGDDPKDKQTVKAGRQRKAFLLLVIGGGAAAAATAAIMYQHHRHKPMESPDRP
jgi:hypothetical protein